MMKYKVFVICLYILIGQVQADAKELKQKKGFKVPDGTAFVTTIDINLDKVRDYIVHSPDQISIYSGIDNGILFNITLDSKADESFLIDVSLGKFIRPDLINDLNGNGVCDIPVRGLSSTGSEYLKIIDPKTGELLLDTRFAPNSDNLFIYDVDGNDTLDVIIERLDSVLIFSSTVIKPSSIFNPNVPAFLATLESYPNPTSQSCTIIWRQLGDTKNENAHAVIVDINGNEIRRLLSDMKEHRAAFEWDGKGSDNNIVPSGVYFVKVSSGVLTKDVPVVVSR